MNLSDALAQERRARLAAERLLELKQAELFAANQRLSRHALSLSDEIIQKRQEITSVKTVAEALKGENVEVQQKYARAHTKAIEAERQLWAALQTVRDGFALFDEEHRLLVANDAYLAIFDGIESICPGAHWRHLVHMAVEEGIVDTQGEGGEAWTRRIIEWWDEPNLKPEVFRLWNGEFVRLIAQRTPDGGMVNLGINITEQMRIWAAIETIPDGFVLCDMDDRLLMCNARYKEIYQESAPVMVPGTPFEELVRHGVERGQFSDAIGREEEWLEERLAQHRAADEILEQRLSNGRWLRVFERPTPDGGRVGLRVDITDLKEQQEALRISTERAEAANRAKSAFLANMSHEIRTPMNGVVGMAELLCETPLNEEQRLYVETIRNSGEALLVIINDVLDYSKIEAEKLQLHPEAFDLERCIHEVVMLLRPTAQQKGLELIVDYDMFLPTQFVGDPGRMRQVLTNLIGNAVKFTPGGHVIVRTVGLPDGDETRIHVSVEDTGIGIPAEKIEHVFGEFNQVEDERNRKFEGTGLGLSITSRLIELMGGEIWVDSVVGEGSCFGFHATMPTVGQGEPSQPEIPGWIKRAVVVETHTATSDILTKQLTALGLKVTRFASVDELLASDQASQADALVMEQHTDPEESINELRQIREGGFRCPALVLHSHSRVDEADIRSLDADFLKKPPLRRELLAALSNLAPRDGAEPSPPLRRMRILAAEDNRTNQLVLSKILKSLEVELKFASNGREAVELFGEFHPDMIFMDISMPEMDGKAATRRIREIEADRGLRRTPVIALTAHAMSGDETEILAAGLDHYLTKPLKKVAIFERIRAAHPEDARDPMASIEPGDIPSPILAEAAAS